MRVVQFGDFIQKASTDLTVMDSEADLRRMLRLFGSQLHDYLAMQPAVIARGTPLMVSIMENQITHYAQQSQLILQELERRGFTPKT